MTYKSQSTVTESMLKSVAEICELVESELELAPQLRSQNRIRTIHASLAIENNSLSEKQVSAVIDDEIALGAPREIREVQNAFATYEEMSNWQSNSLDDLFKAREILMSGLVDEAGKFRKSQYCQALAACDKNVNSNIFI